MFKSGIQWSELRRLNFRVRVTRRICDICSVLARTVIEASNVAV